MVKKSHHLIIYFNLIKNKLSFEDDLKNSKFFKIFIDFSLFISCSQNFQNRS